MNSKKAISIFILFVCLIFIYMQQASAIGLRGPIRFEKIYLPNEYFELEYEITARAPSIKGTLFYTSPEGMEGIMTWDKETFFLKPGKPEIVTFSSHGLVEA